MPVHCSCNREFISSTIQPLSAPKGVLGRASTWMGNVGNLARSRRTMLIIFSGVLSASLSARLFNPMDNTTLCKRGNENRLVSSVCSESRQARFSTRSPPLARMATCGARRSRIAASSGIHKTRSAYESPSHRHVMLFWRGASSASCSACLVAVASRRLSFSTSAILRKK